LRAWVQESSDIVIQPSTKSPGLVRLAAALAALATLLLAPTPGFTQRDEGGLALIRDAETEAYLRKMCDPIFLAAGLDPSAVHIYLINDGSINAFVAEGQNVFVHTGLIQAADTPNQIAGVLAHETGHMAAGHMIRTSEALGKIQRPMLVGMLLGIGAMLGGAPDVGAAILTGSQTIGLRSVLSYTRAQEAATDQAGVRYLEQTHQSGRGLLEFFQKLSRREIQTSRKIDPYQVDHPLSAERISLLERAVNASSYANVRDTPETLAQLKLIQGKIAGFLEKSEIVMRRYPVTDRSAGARYARSAGYYRQGLLADGLSEIDSLLKEEPKNPYFWELKGQMLFESGKVVEALEPYRTSIKFLPRDGLIHVGLGQALINAAEAERNPAHLDEAISVLNIAKETDRELPIAWRFLAQAYSAKNDTAMADYATAELNASFGNIIEAGRFAMRARDKLPRGTVAYNRAQDIIALAQDAVRNTRQRSPTRRR
jgi:predicted Zn-dependent protease